MEQKIVKIADRLFAASESQVDVGQGFIDWL